MKKAVLPIRPDTSNHRPGQRQLFAFIFLLFLPFLLHAQAPLTPVKGIVVDQAGQPVAGVSVTVKGTTRGVTTKENGSFQLDAPAKATLVFSSIGYVLREVAVNQNRTINITLVSSAGNLDQVVVVGYGTQRKKDITGAISSVGEQAIKDVPSGSISDALQGKAAGLDIQNVGTAPGAPTQIRVRGTRSISGSNAPLLILDGIPYDGDLNDINPDDVASVDILKDASATAIYGSRGSNGVILVTTKKGKAGETRVAVSTYYGFGRPAYKYPVYNAAQYQAMRAASPWTQGYQPLEDSSIAKGTSTNWQNLMYGTASKTDNNITVSGGAGASTFSLGAGYYKETAVLPAQDFTRYSVRAAIDTKIGKHMKIGLNSLNSVSVINGSQFVNAGVMFPIIALSPLMPAYTSTGQILKAPDGNVNDLGSIYSPLYLKHNNNDWVDRITRIKTFNALYAEYEFIPGLKYRFNLGLTFTEEEDDQFQASDDSTGVNPSFFRPGETSFASVNHQPSWEYTAENLLTYDKAFGKSRLNFTGLYSDQQYHQHNTYISQTGLNDNFTQFYNLGLANPAVPPTVSGNELSWALLSYMGRINYVYDNKYMLTVTGRADGSSRLADGHKWHDYPAVSAGWNIGDEKFMSSTAHWLSSLKLRAGFGQTSNQSINPYQSLGLVSNTFAGAVGPLPSNNVIYYNYGPTVVQGYNVQTLPNPNLDWEYTKTINLGLDYGILRNRITGSIDYYHQHTDKILYNVTLPASSGVSGPYTTNVGQMQNWGMEFAVSSINIKTKDFTWSTDLNLFFNRNKLLALSTGVNEDIANQLFVGYSMTSIYDYKKVGIWQTGEASQAAVYNSTPGQIKLADIHNTNAPLTAAAESVIGNGDAKLQGGMTNRFTYKNFDFSFTAYARFGGLLVSQVHQSFSDYLTNLDGQRSGVKVDYWTKTNPTNWFPNPSAQSLNQTTYAWSPVGTAWTTLGYYSATFVKLQSINLGYNFSPDMLKHLGVQRVRVYATLDNVATLFSPFLKQTGVDPTGTTAGAGGVQNPGNLRPDNGTGNGAITINASTPVPRYFMLGLNLGF